MNSDDRNNWVTSNRKKNVQNIQYGVDINDREAVLNEYNRMKKKHNIVGVFLAIFALLISFYFFDFYMVNYNGRKPILSFVEEVDGGVLYKAIGYKALYCNNGQTFIGTSSYKNCSELVGSTKTFEEVFHDEFLTYMKKENRYDETNILEFKLHSITFDSKNEDGSDYLVNLSYKCMDGSNKCFKSPKDFGDKTDIVLYVSLNKFNEVINVSGFKDSGTFYDQLVDSYTEKIKLYMINNDLMKADNLKSLDIKLTKNYGRYTFEGTTYADSYSVHINYSCLDNSNTCVVPFKNDYYENYNFEASMFLDEEDNILLFGPVQYFEK